MADLSPSAGRALAILAAAGGGRLSRPAFARAMWPDHAAWTDHEGPPKPADVIYTAGGYLGRLRAKGWVDVDPDGAIITTAGASALSADPGREAYFEAAALATNVSVGTVTQGASTSGGSAIGGAPGDPEANVADALVEPKASSIVADFDRYMGVEATGKTTPIDALAEVHAGEIVVPAGAVVKSGGVSIGTTSEPSTLYTDPHRKSRRRMKARAIVGGRRKGDEPDGRHGIVAITLDGPAGSVTRCTACLRPVRKNGAKVRGVQIWTHVKGGTLPTDEA